MNGDFERQVIDDILHRMNAAGMTQRELSKRLGVSEARVSQMLRTGSNMTMGTVDKILSVLS